jgi:hypothetical protein
MICRTLGFFLILAISVPVAAQRLEPGYIVLNNGDTLEGVVYSKNRYREIEFTNGERPLKAYKAGDIKAFSAYNEIFNSLEIRDQKTDERRTTFAKYLISGSVSLYELEDRTFIILSDSLPEPRVLRGSNFHYYYAKDCPDLVPFVRKMNTNSEDSQVEFFKKLNECRGTSYKIYLSPINEAYVYFYAEAGYGASNLKFFSDPDDVNHSNLKFNVSMAPLFGMGMERYAATRRRQTFSFYFSLSATKALMQGRVDERSGSDFTYENLVFDYYSVNFSAIAKKNIAAIKSNTISIGGGFIFEHHFVEKALWIDDKGTSSSITTRTNDVPIYASNTIGVSTLISYNVLLKNSKPLLFSLRPNCFIGYKFRVMTLSAMVSVGLNKRKVT